MLCTSRKTGNCNFAKFSILFVSRNSLERRMEAEVGRRVSVSALPPELWREILSFLPLKDLLCSASLCCHSWLVLLFLFSSYFIHLNINITFLLYISNSFQDFARSDWIWTAHVINTYGKYSLTDDGGSAYEQYKTLSKYLFLSFPFYSYYSYLTLNINNYIKLFQ